MENLGEFSKPFSLLTGAIHLLIGLLGNHGVLLRGERHRHSFGYANSGTT